MVTSPARPAIRRCAVSSILALRHEVLRPSLPASSAQFPGDAELSTIHLAAIAADGGAIIGCASLMLSSHAGVTAYQLRGMAIAAGYRGLGLGGRLLIHAEELARAAGVGRCWCNARTPAIAFYAKHGWAIDSDEFDIPTAGPHRRMVRHH